MAELTRMEDILQVVGQLGDELRGIRQDINCWRIKTDEQLAALLRRVDALEQRTGGLEQAGEARDKTVSDLARIMDRLMQSDAVLRREEDRCALERQRTYQAFDAEGYPHLEAMRELDAQGRLIKDRQGKRTRVVRISPERVTRAVVVKVVIE